MNAKISGAEKETAGSNDPDRTDSEQIRDNEFGILKMFLLCLAGFIVGRLFIFPGFLDPFVPTHLDLFRYFMIGQEQWGPHAWLEPRPLMMAFLHLLGILHYPALIWFVLSLTSVMFAAALLLLLQQLGKFRPHIISVLLYGMIIFSLPTSFEIYQLDFGGMLAGVLSILAIFTWLHFHKSSLMKALSLSLILYWISLETKPTFAVTMLLLSFIQTVYYRDKKTLLLFIGIFFISILVVLKDRFLGSAFIDFKYDSWIYSIQINPMQNMYALWIYIGAAIPKELLPGLVIACFLFARAFKRGWAIIIALVAVAVSSIVPMALIPNRVLDLYAWYCGMLMCIPFLYVLQADVDVASNTGWIRSAALKALLPACLLITIVAMSMSIARRAPLAAFDLLISNYNRNVLASLKDLSQQSLVHEFSASDGILITGLRGPFHPFKNRAFIQNRIHLPDTYVLMLRTSEIAWNAMSNDIGPGVYSNELDIDAFSYFVLYDQDGNFSNILSLEEIKALPEWQRIPTLVCNLNPALQTWTIHALENTAGCLDAAGESAVVIELITHAGTSDPSPVLHYYLGNAYAAMGDVPAARAEYELALASSENSYFREALERLPDK